MSTFKIIHKLTHHEPTSRDQMTYLLSASSLTVLQSSYVRDAIRSLLNRPKTSIILLVPEQTIVHAAVLRLSRLPKAGKSSLRVFPFDPLIATHDEDVVQCMRRIASVKRIDGCMAFEVDREFRLRIAAITSLVNG